MATSKTSSFWLTETVQVAVGASRGTSTLDLGAYVDVGDQQAISVEEIEYIVQREDGGVYDSNINNILPDGGSLTFQVTDLNPGNLVLEADDNTIIGQGQLHVGVYYDGAATANNNIWSHSTSFHPDVFGKLDETRMVVNDNMYCLVDVSGNVIGQDLSVTFRIKARIVKLATKDWMAIAIQSTASDN
jgi:hypothetical protein